MLKKIAATAAPRFSPTTSFMASSAARAAELATPVAARASAAVAAIFFSVSGSGAPGMDAGMTREAAQLMVARLHLYELLTGPDPSHAPGAAGIVRRALLVAVRRRASVAARGDHDQADRKGVGDAHRASRGACCAYGVEAAVRSDAAGLNRGHAQRRPRRRRRWRRGPRGDRMTSSPPRTIRLLLLVILALAVSTTAALGPRRRATSEAKRAEPRRHGRRWRSW